MQVLLTLLCLVLSLPLCAQAQELTQDTARRIAHPDHDIVVLYTNDVHGGFEKDANYPRRLGYSSLAAYRIQCRKETPYVTLLDGGDSISGNTFGSVSRGEYLVSLMNAVGYDFCTLGNHEADYGRPQLVKLLRNAKAQYLACNLHYTGPGTDDLTPFLKPYTIVTYGEGDKAVKVGFIGVTAVDTLTTSNPETFKQDGELVYDFCNQTPETLFHCVQKNINACRRERADYIIVISHLGDEEVMRPYTSWELIEHTCGLDAVIDAHSHSVIPQRLVKNNQGHPVVLTTSGAHLEAIGKLVIGCDGAISSSLITEVQGTDATVDQTATALKKLYKSLVQAVVANTRGSIPNPGHLVCCRETPMGDFCADALRFAAQADVAIINGGGIRHGLPAGQVTYEDVINVHPFGNHLVCCLCKGQDILDALEHGYRAVQLNLGTGPTFLGGSGGFLSVSGLRCTIDTSIPSSVQVGANGLFAGVKGKRRVKNVMVLNREGKYEPLDPQAPYRLASTDFILQKCGDGYNMFADKKFIINHGPMDHKVITGYIKQLNGDLSRFARVDGRIRVK